MNVDVDGLRAAAEAATAGPWTALHGIGIGPGEVHAVDFTPLRRVSAASTKTDARYIAAADPVVVLALLDRLQAAERRADMLESLLVAAKPPITAQQIEWAQERYDESQRLIQQAGIDAGRRLYAETADAPRGHVAAPLSASGAESDHGDRREGEGLACACRGMDEKPGCNHDREERP